MSVIDWLQLLWTLAVASAVGGGVFSLIAFYVGRKRPQDEAARKKSHALYLFSYVLMSISIFFIAFRGLLK